MHLRFWYICDIGIFAIKLYSDTIVSQMDLIITIFPYFHNFCFFLADGIIQY